MSNLTKRYRSWTFVLYPESCPDDWQEKLIGVPFVRSPLHDMDTNADGSPKKPHWHVLVSFDSMKSYEQIRELTEALNAPSPQSCKDTRALCRYFLHLDNPEKAQYNKADLLVGGGFDIDTALKLSKSAADADERSFIADLIEAIDKHNMTEFEDLFLYVMHEIPESYQLFKQNAFVLSQVVKSRRHRQEARE